VRNDFEPSLYSNWFADVSRMTIGWIEEFVRDGKIVE
jgi:hypothetical protein